MLCRHLWVSVSSNMLKNAKIIVSSVATDDSCSNKHCQMDRISHTCMVTTTTMNRVVTNVDVVIGGTIRHRSWRGSFLFFFVPFYLINPRWRGPIKMPHGSFDRAWSTPRPCSVAASSFAILLKDHINLKANS